VGGGVHTGSTRHVGYLWQIVLAPGDCEDGYFGGMKIGRGHWSTRRKPDPAPICPRHVPLDQTRAWTRAAAVGSQRQPLELWRGLIYIYLTYKCTHSELTSRKPTYFLWAIIKSGIQSFRIADQLVTSSILQLKLTCMELMEILNSEHIINTKNLKKLNYCGDISVLLMFHN
jgi:hypothetical protein